MPALHVAEAAKSYVSPTVTDRTRASRSERGAPSAAGYGAQKPTLPSKRPPLRWIAPAASRGRITRATAVCALCGRADACTRRDEHYVAPVPQQGTVLTVEWTNLDAGIVARRAAARASRQRHQIELCAPCVPRAQTCATSQATQAGRAWCAVGNEGCWPATLTSTTERLPSCATPPHTDSVATTAAMPVLSPMTWQLGVYACFRTEREASRGSTASPNIKTTLEPTSDGTVARMASALRRCTR